MQQKVAAAVRRWFGSQKAATLVFMFNPLIIGLAILSFRRDEWWVTVAAGVCFGIFFAFLPVWLGELRASRAPRS